MQSNIRNFCSRQCVGAFTIRRQGGRSSSLENTVSAALGRTGIDYLPQARIGRWLVDFYIPSLRLVIECDGIYWHSLPQIKKRDVRKNAWLHQHGYNLLRIPESSIRRDLADAILAHALSLAQEAA